MILQPPSALLEGSQIIAGFADLPPKPPRSKLEPHRDLIRELRRKGKLTATSPACFRSGSDCTLPRARFIRS